MAADFVSIKTNRPLPEEDAIALRLHQELDQATHKLQEAHEKLERISIQDLQELARVLESLKENIDLNLAATRASVSQESDAKIEKALEAMALFQNAAIQERRLKEVRCEEVEEAILSLTSSLCAILDQKEDHLKNLESYRVGQRVEGVSRSKEAN